MASPRDNGELRQLFAEPGSVVLYAWKNILVYVWGGHARVELMNSLKPVLTGHVSEVGTVSVVSVMTMAPELPDENRRRAYKELLLALGNRIAFVSVILEGEGFLGSAIRGSLTGLLMVTGRQQMFHMASNPEQAAAWLSPKHAAATGVALKPTDLSRTFEEARARAIGVVRGGT